MESPSCLDKVDETVEMIAETPDKAASNEALSFKSPTTVSTPISFNLATVAASDVARTSPLTCLFFALSWRQISLPKWPVAPATRMTEEGFELLMWLGFEVQFEK